MLIATLCGLCFSQLATAKSLPANPVFKHVSNDEPLVDLLRGFGAELGLPVIISSQVEGKVNAQFRDRPRAFLSKVATVYNLIWYFDGSSLYVYHQNEVMTKVIKSEHLSIRELERSLKNLGVLDETSKWQSLPRQKIAYISGTPRYIELAKELTEILDKKASTQAESSYTIEVFPLKYALAYDQVHTVRGEKVTTKGVATILHELVGNGQTAQVSVTDENDVKTMAEPSPVATIKANQRLNAVVIRDKPANMALYSELINSLDRPANQVEIDVSMIDISTDKISKLGIDIEHTKDSASRGSFTFDSGMYQQAKNAVGGGATTLVVGKASEFFGRLSMLKQDGDAKVLSRPSVLTVDKVEAVIDHSRTFYVKVSGREVADLKSVTVGTMVRVTPRIVEESDGRWIHLSVDLEDGDHTGGVVDNLPIVSKSTINTNAIIAEDSSLLVGGFFRDKQESSSRKIPILGDLPILSYFFNWESDNSERVTRLFLISPRILNVNDGRNNVSATDVLGSFKGMDPRKSLPRFGNETGFSGESK